MRPAATLGCLATALALACRLGPGGPAGAAGEPGGPGLGAYQIVRQGEMIAAAGGLAVRARCPEGTSVVGGGWRTGGPSVSVASSAPSRRGDLWLVWFMNSSATFQQVEVAAICARAGRGGR